MAIATLLTINGVIINPDELQDIQVFSSIGRILPLLSFKIKDRSGIHWKELNFSIGSKVEVSYTDGIGGDAKQVCQTTQFNIVRMYDGYEYTSDALGGYIQVWCEQAWRFNGDFNDHAYNKEKMSDLIKEICKNASNRKSETGVAYNKKNFEDSTDSGSIRYKLACSDLEFLENSILPITMVDTSNSIFYMTKQGIVNFSSFSKLFSKKETVILYPNIEGKGWDDQLQQVIKDKNIEPHQEYLSIDTMIGSNASAIDHLKSKLYLFNPITGSTSIGNQMPTVTSGSDQGNVIRTALPVKDVFLRNITATSASFIPNKSLEDQVGQSRNILVDTNDMFSCTIVIPTLMIDATIGQTIFLWVPAVKNKELDENGEYVDADHTSNHWVLGKWLIEKEAVITLSPTTVATKIKLIRPTFYVGKDKTTVSDIGSFYRI